MVGLVCSGAYADGRTTNRWTSQGIFQDSCQKACFLGNSKGVLKAGGLKDPLNPKPYGSLNHSEASFLYLTLLNPLFAAFELQASALGVLPGHLWYDAEATYGRTMNLRFRVKGVRV